ncbi:MAG: hypothetical protein QM743_06140 [Chitinophagaceae bacterium]|uniref:Cell division protein ZapB n=1 Tax=Rurimicrobium arvi TaxID=2049916 RepID=A0ABP8MKM3_9BACT
MKELEVLHQKVAVLVEKFQESRDEINRLKAELEQRNMQLAEAQMQINILKPALDEAQGVSSERNQLQGQIDKALDDVNKILSLLDGE